MLSSQNAGSNGFRFLHLKNIEVTFKHKKPRYPVKIKVIPGNSVSTSKEYTNSNVGAHRWETDIHLSPDDSLEIITKESHALRCLPKRDFASIRLEATDIGKNDAITKDDERGLISVKVTFAPPMEARTVVQKGAEDALDLIKKKPIALDKLGKARKFVEVVKQFGDILSSIHPAAKAAVISFNLLYQKFEEQEAVHNDASELIDDLQQFLPFTDVIDPATLTNESARSAIQDFLTVFKETCEFIVKYSSSNILGDLISSQSSKVGELKSRFMKSKGNYDWSIKTDVWKINLKIEKIRDNDLLKLLHVSTLGPAGKEFYRTDMACLPGTRSSVLDQISQWAESSDRKLLWMCGSPGSGKSAIANSAARMFDSRRLLAGCFFCRRADLDLRDTSKVIPSLAAHLAMWHQPYSARLLSALQGEERNKFASKTLQEHFDLLIKGPILAVSSNDETDSPDPLVIVVDGLDECGKARGERFQLAKILVQIAELVPWLKLLVTSRPLQELSQVFAGSPELLEKLDLGQAGDPTADILLYAKHRFDVVAQENGLDEEWITEEKITTLVEKSQGRFIWISCALSFIEMHTDVEHAVEVALSAPPFEFEHVDGDIALLCMESLQKAECDRQSFQ